MQSNLLKYPYKREERELTNSFKNTSLLSRIFFSFGIVIICLECLFYNFLNIEIKNLSLPVFLWPSEVWFVCIGCVLFSLHITKTGFKFKIQNSGPIIIIVSVFLIALIHGVLVSNPYALREFREIAFGAFSVPIVILLAPHYNLNENFKNLIYFSSLLVYLFFLIVFLETIISGYSNVQSSIAFTLFLMFILSFLFIANACNYKSTFVPLLLVSLAILLNFSKLSIANYLFTLAVSFFCVMKISKSRYLKLGNINIKLLSKIFILFLFSVFTLFLYDRFSDGSLRKVFLLNFYKVRLSTEGDLFLGDKTGGRFAIWNESIEVWLEKPILGHGLGKEILIYSSGWTKKFQLHNYFLQLLQNIGLLGMIIISLCFVFWFIKIFLNIKNTRSLKSKIFMYSCLVFLLTVMFNGLYGHSLSHPPISVLFWICVGFLSSSVLSIKRSTNIHNIS